MRRINSKINTNDILTYPEKYSQKAHIEKQKRTYKQGEIYE